jgi:DNA-binding XRE family transcriptional regulator
MIKNHRQYIVTKAQVKKFQKASEEFDKKGSNAHPMLVKAQKEAMKSQLSELEDQVREYERLRSGRYRVLKASSLEKLPVELIRARIALGLTQKQLAKRLGVREQQIQRYEETEYASASFSRLAEVANALRLDIKEQITLPKRQNMQNRT